MQLKQLQLCVCCCVSCIGTEAITQQQIVKLNGILCRQEHYHFALTAITLAITYHITTLQPLQCVSYD